MGAGGAAGAGVVRRQPRHALGPRRGARAAHQRRRRPSRLTIEAAYSWRQEDRIGSIAPGKIANFTVLKEDPYAVEPTKLKDVPVWGTVFEGAVYPVARG